MRRFKRLPPAPQLFSLFSFLFLLLVCGCCPNLTALLVYHDSPRLANLKRVTVKRKERREEKGSRTLKLILRTFFET